MLRTVTLRRTHVPGCWQGSDGARYSRLKGTEDRCAWCGRWAQQFWCRDPSGTAGGPPVPICDAHVRRAGRAPRAAPLRRRFLAIAALAYADGYLVEVSADEQDALLRAILSLPPGAVPRRRLRYTARQIVWALLAGLDHVDLPARLKRHLRACGW